MDIFSINKNHACLIYVSYITLLKLTILSLFPLGVMHHEPCFHAGSSTSGFLLGRIRKVSSFLFFLLFSFFYFIFLFLHMGSQVLFLAIAMGGGLRLGSS